MSGVVAVAVGLLLADHFSSQQSDHEPDVLIEPIPKSAWHSPDGTWWGYNQSKVARSGERVFMYVINNRDDSSRTESEFVVYQKAGDGFWEAGASFPTSRPGNILVDSRGVLHAFVFEPLDVAVNDSLGQLMHYWFPQAANGDITNYQSEVAVANDGDYENVNIRVGAAIGPDDTLAVAWGLTENNPPGAGHSEHLYIKRPGDDNWTHLVAGRNLGHDFYYPFVFVTQDSFHLLPVQDDAYEPDPSRYNIYQKILYLKYAKGQWTRDLVADLTSHPLAAERLRLLEQSELWVDSTGQTHIIYKEFTDPRVDWQTQRVVHLRGASGNWSQTILAEGDMDWARLFEANGRLYYLLTSYDELAIQPVTGDDKLTIDLPNDARGFYPYVATRKTGQAISQYLDVVLHASDPNEYETSRSYYLRLHTASLPQE